jgi:Glycosyl transferase family 2
VSGQPLVSVIVPAFNGAQYIGQALSSVEHQATHDVEVIVIDDGSTDETTSIVESFAGRLPLRLHRLDHCGNWVRVSNAGLTLARGAFACFLHQDDLWLPSRMTELRRLTAEHGASALILTPSVFVDDRGRRLGAWKCPLRQGAVEAAEVTEALLVQNFVAIPAPLFPLSAAREAGGLDEALWYTADWDFWLKMCQLVSGIVYSARPLTAFRVHEASQTMRKAGMAAMREQQETVVGRYLALVDERRRDSVARMAGTSIAVNTAVAKSSASDLREWPHALVSLAKLGPVGATRYAIQSRALERISARLRARLRKKS